MKLVYNKFIPVQGYKYMNIAGLIFTRSKRLADPANWDPVDYNHEAIHSAQWKELLYIFYIPAYIFHTSIANLFLTELKCHFDY